MTAIRIPPDRQPVLAAVSCAVSASVVSALRRFCDAVVLLPPDPLLAAPVASHADMLLFPIGGCLVLHRTYYEAARSEVDAILRYTELQPVFTDCPRGDVYPLDVSLNALLCGRFLFGRLDVLAPEIPVLAEKNGITPVHIRQGYAGCSGLAAEDAIITADPSLTGAALAHGISVIPVPDRDILLPGYDHGFFGGCGGVWKNRIFLCGTPSPEAYGALFRYVHASGKTVIPLTDAPLLDCGGIRFFARSF